MKTHRLAAGLPKNQPHDLHHKSRRSLLLLAIPLLIWLGGCSVTPEPLKDQEVKDRMKSNLSLIDSFNEPIIRPISLHEAMARALKYNLDYRVEWSRRILKETELAVSRHEMLPDLVAQMEFNKRSNYSGASSRSLLDGEESLEASTSQEKDIFTNKLELSWNVLDFGLSYYRARQMANEILIASEEKRKVIHRLLQNVRSAYWRTVSATQLTARLKELKSKVESVIVKSDNVIRERLQMPVKALKQRRSMLDLKNQINSLEEDLRVAKLQLAALMNIRDPSSFDIVIPEDAQAVPELKYHINQLEEYALMNRPELRQLDYKKRIASSKAKTALLGMLPSLNLGVSANHTSNKYVYNNDWVNAGASVSWDLLRLLSYGSYKDMQVAEESLLEASSLSLSMAILLQVNVSVAQYMHARDQYNDHMRYFDTQRAIGDQVDKMRKSERIGRQEHMRETLNSLLSELRYYDSVSKLQTAYANVTTAAGLDPKSLDPDLLSLSDLIASLKEFFPE